MFDSGELMKLIAKLMGDIGESQDMYWDHAGTASDIIAYQIVE